MKRNLIIVRAGDDSLHTKWIDDNRPRNFDLFISYYGSNRGQYSEQANYYSCDDSVKYKALATLLSTSTDILYGYDAYWFPDDDLLTDSPTIVKMFDLFHQYELWLAQPALGDGSYINHSITKLASGMKLRYTNFVECMCPLFNQRALTILSPTFTFSGSGWGLDYLWPHLLGDPNDRIAVLDETAVVHTRMHKSGPLYKRCSELGINPRADMQQLLAKYDFPLKRKFCVYKAIPAMS